MSDYYFYRCTRCKGQRREWGVNPNSDRKREGVDVLEMIYECGTVMSAIREKGNVTEVIWKFCKHAVISGSDSNEVLKGRWG